MKKNEKWEDLWNLAIQKQYYICIHIFDSAVQLLRIYTTDTPAKNDKYIYVYYHNISNCRKMEVTQVSTNRRLFKLTVTHSHNTINTMQLSKRMRSSLYTGMKICPEYAVRLKKHNTTKQTNQGADSV